MSVSNARQPFREDSHPFVNFRDMVNEHVSGIDGSIAAVATGEVIGSVAAGERESKTGKAKWGRRSGLF